jgi:hypothetical protein
MPKKQPNFTKSPYFVNDPGNWHLKTGAPEEVQEEFENYMFQLRENFEPGTLNGNTIDYPFNK